MWLGTKKKENDAKLDKQTEKNVKITKIDVKETKERKGIKEKVVKGRREDGKRILKKKLKEAYTVNKKII
jgi:hypothetical protein